MFLRNCWYVAGWGHEFGRELKAQKLLGENIVFYRKEDGSPVALENACPHRKLPLSMGSLEGDQVICGYHGLTFDCTGKCTDSPTQRGMTPRRAVVKSYPVVERYRLLWIWMGDPELANADDMGDYYRIRMDHRDLHYKAYFTEGDCDTVQHQDFDSHTTEPLTDQELDELLLSLPEIRAEIAAFQESRR